MSEQQARAYPLYALGEIPSRVAPATSSAYFRTCIARSDVQVSSEVGLLHVSLEGQRKRTAFVDV